MKAAELYSDLTDWRVRLLNDIERWPDWCLNVLHKDLIRSAVQVGEELKRREEMRAANAAPEAKNGERGS